ncbi:endonuclease 8-like 1 isoform X1 [Echinops telfairi]|uniref:Endonuclease 8-like 1 isoform X1 n=4 Tax=Echinops telfairi TaxID=9371 RepID=A0AC55CN71_ECHTE|nr:endonuclease 8-like 1 isoform X1 [Echinops telfairi]XP_045141643.1 endonuclease 8-like 1 isoform X1 [Echinops telfairi]XP_045141644.1 endonuclease 8-like 1 isoform X1 [Echinops telfairi]XP_045141647.1 endonuclease 8-like 1 isoform X1 [Echinops telfairi]
MPEGPELQLASLFVNKTCKGLVFGGPVEKSAVSRNAEVPFESSAYSISATARGKELRLTLSPLPGAQPPREPLALVFRFGMSGSFQMAPGDALPRHAHLRFHTAPPGPRRALCFVDIRRFGHWDLGGEWQPGRGPCVIQEYEQFRENVLQHLEDKIFDRPICEALLDQRFFNGIGNYLRAEILHRLKIPPFEKARTVMEALKQRRPSPELTLSKKIKDKLQNPDLLELCHSVPKEVVQLGGKGYGAESGEQDFAAFRAWLRCYSVPGMRSLRDRHGRTIWFQGDPGPLVPKGPSTSKPDPFQGTKSTENPSQAACTPGPGSSHCPQEDKEGHATSSLRPTPQRPQSAEDQARARRAAGHLSFLAGAPLLWVSPPCCLALDLAGACPAS